MKSTPRAPSACDDVILVSHGGGGLRTRRLIEETLRPILSNPILDQLDDGACIPSPGERLVLTTDSYVVDPPFFPGGDIGRLAACGTINDLAMQAAEPNYLTLGLIIEEGFPLRDLERAMRSLAEVLRETDCCVVTGDTKVVERGKGGGLFINTAGLGVRRHAADGRVNGARPGDAIIVTGTIGDHGMAVMTRREGLRMETEIRSDVAPLWDLVRGLLDAGLSLHALRDPTRGGLTGALCDIAAASALCLRVRERAIPVRPAVRAACGLLGLDPLNVANEGKAVILLPAAEADRALALLRAHPLARDAAVIGRAEPAPAGLALLETAIGGARQLTVPLGEELPRIC
jgi:hydrogenase expression/formation protein HypE